MKITDDQKKIGNENFYAACGTKLIKGDEVRAGEPFHKKAIDAKLESKKGMGGLYFGYGEIEKPVKIGIIGTGDEGGVLIGALNPKYVDVVAIADIRPYNRFRAFHGGKASARPGLFKIFADTHGWKSVEDAKKHVKVYEDDYEEMLDDDDVEAVIVALPLHLHAEATIKALEKGKHVLCEKLMARTVAQAKDMARAAANEEKFLVVGHQRHYSILYANAVELIKQGLLGSIHHIRAQWHREKDSWNVAMPSDIRKKESFAKIQADIAKFEKEIAEFDAGTKDDPKREEAVRKRLGVLRPIAAQADDDTVDAAKYGYIDRPRGRDSKGRERAKHTALQELIRWRLWERTGGGLMAELGSHQLDAASIFVSALRTDGKKVLPISVRGMGGRHIYPLDRDIDDHVYCQFDFPAPDYDAEERPERRIVVSYSSINGNGYGGYGEEVMGTEGTLLLMRESDPMLFAQRSPGWTTQVVEDKKAGRLKLTQNKDKSKDPWKRAYEVGKRGLRGPISRGYTEEIEHWAWCIRNPDSDITPRCSPERALADAVMALVANLAFEQQALIEFDPSWFDIASDATPDGSKPEIKLSAKATELTKEKSDGEDDEEPEAEPAPSEQPVETGA
ncbi:MAG: Gfo/Idh/MocA family oxidoreductase [Pirellulales bacterium]|nr:Gfo/Idh/MocA family oxidoreductase [Pirellulales bacterium]